MPHYVIRGHGKKDRGTETTKQRIRALIWPHQNDEFAQMKDEQL